MTLSVTAQILALLTMMGAGMSVGVLFDLYVLIQNRLPKDTWFKYILDILYWLSSVIVIFMLLLFCNMGEWRWSFIVSIVGGIYFYFKIWSRHIIPILDMMLRMIGWLWKCISYTVVTFIWLPIYYIVYYLYLFVMKIWRTVKRICIGVLLWIWGFIKAKIWK